MQGRQDAILKDFGTQGTDGVTAASKAVELMNAWNVHEGVIKRIDIKAQGYSGPLATDETKIYRVGNLAILQICAQLPEVTTTATANVPCYQLPWAPPTTFADYRNPNSNYRSMIHIEQTGEVILRQYKITTKHVCTIMFPILFDYSDTEVQASE